VTTSSVRDENWQPPNSPFGQLSPNGAGTWLPSIVARTNGTLDWPALAGTGLS